MRRSEERVCVYLVVDVNSPSDLPTAARDWFPKSQPLVTMVTSCCIGILVVELQSTLGQKSLSWWKKTRKRRKRIQYVWAWETSTALIIQNDLYCFNCDFTYKEFDFDFLTKHRKRHTAKNKTTNTKQISACAQKKFWERETCVASV